MKKIQKSIVILVLLLLVGCNDKRFMKVEQQQPFIASVNILEPSLTFFDEFGDQLANWSLEKAYTGAILVGVDSVLLFGHQLTQADLYELSSGQLVRSIDTGVGVTNAYYDEVSQFIFMTNGKTNELTSYTAKGIFQHKEKLGNYPMSMAAANNQLYIVNYKDTILSIVDTKTLELVDEWPISTSSQGLLILQEMNELWIGGHGKGSKPNETVQVYDLTSGKLKTELVMPLMPVAFSQKNDEVAVTSHGSNAIYVSALDGTPKWQQEVGANPFAIAYFCDQLVVAGYDDETLYFLKDHQIQKQVKTGKGPFQLLVREDNN